MTSPGCIQQHNNHSHSCETFTTFCWRAPQAVIQQLCDFWHSAASQLLAIKVRRDVRRQHCFPLCCGDCCTCHTTVLQQFRIPHQNTKCIHAWQTRDCCCLPNLELCEFSMASSVNLFDPSSDQKSTSFGGPLRHWDVSCHCWQSSVRRCLLVSCCSHWTCVPPMANIVLGSDHAKKHDMNWAVVTCVSQTNVSNSFSIQSLRSKCMSEACMLSMSCTLHRDQPQAELIFVQVLSMLLAPIVNATMAKTWHFFIQRRVWSQHSCFAACVSCLWCWQLCQHTWAKFGNGAKQQSRRSPSILASHCFLVSWSHAVLNFSCVTIFQRFIFFCSQLTVFAPSCTSSFLQDMWWPLWHSKRKMCASQLSMFSCCLVHQVCILSVWTSMLNDSFCSVFFLPFCFQTALPNCFFEPGWSLHMCLQFVNPNDMALVKHNVSISDTCPLLRQPGMRQGQTTSGRWHGIHLDGQQMPSVHWFHLGIQHIRFIDCCFDAMKAIVWKSVQLLTLFSFFIQAAFSSQDLHGSFRTTCFVK